MSSLLFTAVIDANGGTRHDRTAMAFRRWALAAQSITGHPSSYTLLVGTERMVSHRRLVAIGIEDVQAGRSPPGITGHRHGQAT